MKYLPHNYQAHATQHIIDHPAAGLFLEMGLGKTVSTLTAIDRLIYEDLSVDRVLVIAPKFVQLHVWKAEIEKWDHLRHLRLSIVTGDPAQRTRALKAKADIYIINRENVTWLVNHYQTAFPFDMVVIDELSSFKDPGSQRFKSLRIVRPRVKRMVGLTGTPAPNGLPDLWSQLYLLDQGERLGKTLTAYREAYLTPDKTNGAQVYSYRVRKGSEQEIYNRIGDICISMKAEDYLQLPGRLEHEIPIIFPADLQKKYDDFEKEQVLSILGDEEITAVNAAVLTGKLLQFSSGAVYDENKQAHRLHDLKLDALEQILEEAGDKQVLIFFNFIHSFERIAARFKNVKKLKGAQGIDRWNAGKFGHMACHPASAGHGLNLQAGGHIIVWFDQVWSLEQYQQANARLDRQGQKELVIIYKLISHNTMDQEVTKIRERKADTQEGLMQAVRARIEKYKKPAF